MRGSGLLILGIATALAGCDASAPPGAANAVDVAVPGPSAPTPVASASADTAATAIPAAFQGRWGMSPADCDPARDDNKGLMVIAADSLRFYESRAVPRDIQLTGPSEWRAVLDYSGEGQTWSEATSLKLGEGGRTLTRLGDGPWTYRRCGVSS